MLVSQLRPTDAPLTQPSVRNGELRQIPMWKSPVKRPPVTRPPVRKFQVKEDSSNEDFCHDKPREGAREESESTAKSENAQINARNSFPGKKTAVPQPRGRAHDSPAPLRSFEHVSRSSVRSRSTSLAEGRTLDHQAHGGSLRTAMGDQRKGKQVVRENHGYR